MDNVIVTNLDVNNEEEEKVEKSLRPRTFSEIIGRKIEKKNLSIMIQAAKKRKEALDHLLFYGPPGLGKTSLSQVVASEMGVSIYITSGPAIERQGDLAAILTNIEEGGILFIDEIHRINRNIEEVLYPAMEDKAIDIIIGKGPSARTVRLDLNNFCLIGATTKAGKLSSPLRDRFGATFRFDFYSEEELAEIVIQKANILGTEINYDLAFRVAQRSRKTPRVAIRILKRIRDLADVSNDGKITEREIKEGLKILGIGEYGLDNLDRKVLQTILDTFDGGPVGISSIAASISEDIETVEDVCEPFLLQEGFIQRTPRGRILTHKAIDYFNRK